VLHREEAWVEGRMESSALDIDKEGETRSWALSPPSLACPEQR